MNFEQAPEFQKELKRLQKKWHSLPSDIKAAERSLVPLYTEQGGVDITYLRRNFFNGKKATILKSTSKAEVVKIRLDVETLNCNNKIRVVFIATVVSHKITFIEIFAKNEKDREDKMRIKKYIKLV